MVIIKIKLVPNNRPDDDGETVAVNVPQEVAVKVHRARGWLTAMTLLAPYNPRPDHHIVKYETGLHNVF